MRELSRKKVKVKGRIFGGEKILICLPLVSNNGKDLLVEANEIIRLKPDVIEWRVDYFGNLNYDDHSELFKSMKSLEKITKNIPVIFTCRHFDEGGHKKIGQEDRIKIIKKSLESGLADIVDVEMINNKEFIEEIKNLVIKYKKHLILSHHNFNETPDEEFILNKIIEGERLGADITKLAVMANSYEDVLKLFNATYRAKSKEVDIPIITMSMGDYGKITRVFGEYFGVDMTFAVGKSVSAPGQISVDKVRKILKLMNSI